MTALRKQILAPHDQAVHRVAHRRIARVGRQRAGQGRSDELRFFLGQRLKSRAAMPGSWLCSK